MWNRDPGQLLEESSYYRICTRSNTGCQHLAGADLLSRKEVGGLPVEVGVHDAGVEAAADHLPLVPASCNSFR